MKYQLDTIKTYQPMAVELSKSYLVKRKKAVKMPKVMGLDIDISRVNINHVAEADLCPGLRIHMPLASCIKFVNFENYKL